MKSFLTTFGVVVLMVVIAVGLFLARGINIDDRVVFMPVQRPDRTVMTMRNEALLPPVRHERVELGGETLAVTTVGDASGPLIVSCFGNASDRVDQGADYAAKILRHGQVLLWDYPGYGDSSGVAGAQRLERVAEDFAPWIEARADGRDIVYWGHSLGGFVCANLASRTSSVRAVILETTAPSVRSVAAAWTPRRLPLRVRFDEALLRFDIPTALSDMDADMLIVGAGRDRVLPVALSRELAGALPNATYLELPDATHFSAGFDAKTQAAVRTLLAGG